MARILVSGLINLETTLQVDEFPIPYFPVRYPFFGLHSTVSGVGYNVALALTTLGDEVRLLSLLASDPPGSLARQALQAAGLAQDYILDQLPETPQSVILYDPSGRRQIHVDLKNAQEAVYPSERFASALAGCDLAVLCNINFSRPLLAQARQAGVPVAIDVHAIASLDDDYNRDFMASADYLFMSHENLPCSPEDWTSQALDRFPARLVVVGLGSQGALLHVRGAAPRRFPARPLGRIVSTIGAGDALFSSFLHFYLKDSDPVAALEKAQLFAAHKIGSAGGAQGFFDEPSLLRLLEI